MSKTNRMRCGKCGMCYEGEIAASELSPVICETCGATSTLCEEDPEGICSGALPPLPRILALGASIILTLVAVKVPFLAVLAFGALVFLSIDVFQGHRKQRADRIALWNRLRDAYAGMSERARDIQAGLVGASNASKAANQERISVLQQFESAQRSLADITAKYETLNMLNAEANRDRTHLAQELELSERSRAELSGKYEKQRSVCDEANLALKNASEKLIQMEGALAEITGRYEAIDPDRKDRLAKDIEAQQKALGLLGDIAQLKITKESLLAEIRELKARIISFEEEELMQSFGFYKPLYDCVDSAAYKLLLGQIRDKQKNMVKERQALRVDTVFSVDNDRSAGKKIVKNLEKLTLKAFNGECDATIDKVTFSNLESIAARITKAYQDLNEVCQPVGISITNAYLNAKIEELHVCYEYQMKLKTEREEQRKIREEMREQARIQKEIEDSKKKIEKEETHFNQIITELQSRMEAAAAAERAQIEELKARMETAAAEEKEKIAELQAKKEAAIAEERAQYEAKLHEYEAQLAGVHKDKEEVLYRERSTRAGYVYIISNIGSFGEHVFKIGVTRRLAPQERIDELGDASVPFDFDVHALIFSEDAPALEGALHEHFADRAINKVNPRKEFFRVSLKEIEEVVRTHHDKVVEFTEVAKAEDYWLTQAKIKAGMTNSSAIGVN